MGAKKKDSKPKKNLPGTVSQAVTNLADDAFSPVRRVAESLKLDKVLRILQGEEVISAVRDRFDRGGAHYTLEEAASKAGLPADTFAQLNLACGFANPSADAKVFTDEDVEVLQIFQASTEIFGEDVALQNVRVLGSAMARVADALISSFATTIGRESEKRTVTPEDLDRMIVASLALLPSAIRAMDVLLRRHLDVRSRTGDEFHLRAKWQGVDTVERAIGFCDLVSFTELSQRISAARLASVVRAFETTAADLITSCGANVVKLIGDEVMFVAPDANTAVDVCLRLVETFGASHVLPPVRCGIAAGRVIVQEGDYHGPVVTLAARIVKLAPPGGVVVPRAIAHQLRGRRVEDAGFSELKGFDEPVELIRVIE